MRKNTKTIIWTVIISFSLWGAYSVSTGFQKEGRLAGEVFGKGVSFQEFNRFYRSSQIFSFNGKPIENPDLLKQQTWQSIVYSREAKQKGIQVSDDEVRAEIKRLLQAQGIQTVTPDIYQRWLRSAVRESPQDFEQEIRELLRVQKLLIQVHDQPVSQPSRNEALKKFLLESQTLTAEAVRFDHFEEATTFYLKFKDPKKWATEIPKTPNLNILKIDKLPLEDFVTQWQVSEEDALKLIQDPKESVSAPLPTAQLYSVFHLVDKEVRTEKEFGKDLEVKYLKQLTDQKQYEKFMQWNLQLREKAQLKDYLPRSESGNVPNS